MNTMRGWRDSLNPAVSAAHDLIGKITADFGDQQKAAGRAKTALDAYTTAVQQHGIKSDQAKAARQQLIKDLINAGVNAGTARTAVGNYTTAIAQNGLKSDAAKTARQSLISDILGASSNAKRGMTDLNNYTTAVQKNGLQSNAAKAARAQLIKDLENSGVNAKTATGLVDGLGSSIKNLPAGKQVNITMTGKGTFTIKDLTGQGLGVQGPPPGVAHAARGMYVATGTPGVDDQLILAQRGELVVPTPIVASGAVDHLKGRIPGFAQGGVVGGADTAAPRCRAGGDQREPERHLRRQDVRRLPDADDQLDGHDDEGVPQGRGGGCVGRTDRRVRQVVPGEDPVRVGRHVPRPRRRGLHRLHPGRIRPLSASAPRGPARRRAAG